jgi:hypothetical protein
LVECVKIWKRHTHPPKKLVFRTLNLCLGQLGYKMALFPFIHSLFVG